MNEKLMDFLESSETRWNNIYRMSEKPVNIFTFIDSVGGSWNVKDLVGPCGGPIESKGNQYRRYWYCPAHENEGTLINLHRDNSFCWLPPVKEAKK